MTAPAWFQPQWAPPLELTPLQKSSGIQHVTFIQLCLLNERFEWVLLRHTSNVTSFNYACYTKGLSGFRYVILAM